MVAPWADRSWQTRAANQQKHVDWGWSLQARQQPRAVLAAVRPDVRSSCDLRINVRRGGRTATRWASQEEGTRRRRT